MDKKYIFTSDASGDRITVDEKRGHTVKQILALVAETVSLIDANPRDRKKPLGQDSMLDKLMAERKARGKMPDPGRVFAKWNGLIR
jgi:hypothetical protein